MTLVYGATFSSTGVPELLYNVIFVRCQNILAGSFTFLKYFNDFVFENLLEHFLV